MAILSNIVLVLAIIVAFVFSALVLITGKGDAMSGGGGVRTTYKGKATFDDIMSQAALYLGIAFMGLVLLYNVVSTRAQTESSLPSAPVHSSAPVANNAPASNNSTAANSASNSTPSNTPASNDASGTGTPSNNAPTTHSPATNAPETNAPAASSNNASH